ncbi:hypothetical protein BT69DRAFT_1330122 [Atractiella rhizophila]|nr:hypothetical protein BT69DRAFT_1330122 [Atractiella rhizophila]
MRTPIMLISEGYGTLDDPYTLHLSWTQSFVDALPLVRSIFIHFLPWDWTGRLTRKCPIRFLPNRHRYLSDAVHIYLDPFDCSLLLDDYATMTLEDTYQYDVVKPVTVELPFGSEAHTATVAVALPKVPFVKRSGVCAKRSGVLVIRRGVQFSHLQLTTVPSGTESPIAALPVEILSLIFEQLVLDDHDTHKICSTVCKLWWDHMRILDPEPSSGFIKYRKLVSYPKARRFWTNLHCHLMDSLRVDVRNLVDLAIDFQQAITVVSLSCFSSSKLFDEGNGLIALATLSSIQSLTLLGWSQQSLHNFLKTTCSWTKLCKIHLLSWHQIDVLPASLALMEETDVQLPTPVNLSEVSLEHIYVPHFIHPIFSGPKLSYLSIYCCLLIRFPSSYQPMDELIVSLSPTSWFKHLDLTDMVFSESLQPVALLDMTKIILDGGHEVPHDLFSFIGSLSQFSELFSLDLSFCSLNFQGFLDFLTGYAPRQIVLHLFFGEWEEEDIRSAFRHASQLYPPSYYGFTLSEGSTDMIV